MAYQPECPSRIASADRPVDWHSPWEPFKPDIQSTLRSLEPSRRTLRSTRTIRVGGPSHAGGITSRHAETGLDAAVSSNLNHVASNPVTLLPDGTMTEQMSSRSQPRQHARLGYKYDVFLSFPRAGTAFQWVRNHFYPVLKDTLTDEMGRHPAIFAFMNQPTGVNWMQNVVGSLRRSRFMVAVWAPPYFESPWCCAEWESMRLREQALGLPNEQAPRGLVYPVIYRDGNTFPEAAKATFVNESDDMSKYALPMPQFRETPDFIPFYAAVRGVAENLASILQTAPPWQPDWPVLTPEPDGFSEPPSVQPRL